MLQLYPSGPEQAELITSSALRVGFSGGLVVDFPNSTRAKKYFLVLMAGPSDGALPRHADGDEGGEVRPRNAGPHPCHGITHLTPAPSSHGPIRRRWT